MNEACSNLQGPRALISAYHQKIPCIKTANDIRINWNIFKQHVVPESLRCGLFVYITWANTPLSSRPWMRNSFSLRHRNRTPTVTCLDLILIIQSPQSPSFLLIPVFLSTPMIYLAHTSLNVSSKLLYEIFTLRLGEMTGRETFLVSI